MSTIDQPSKMRPKPGFYKGVSFAEYCGWDALNFHTLMHYAKSPMQAHHYMIRGDDDSKSKRLGDAAHAAVLQADVFAKQYIEIPNFGPMQSSTNRAKRDEWVSAQEQAGKVCKTSDEMRHARAIRTALERHPIVNEILFKSKGVNEVSFVWEQRGQLCKGRVDRLCEWRGEFWIVDLKTTRFPWQEPFEREIAKFSYHTQLGTYRSGLSQLPNVQSVRRKAMIIGIQNDEPYEPLRCWFNDRDLDRAAKRFDGWLQQHQSCVKASAFPPAITDGFEVVLPKWADRDLGEAFGEEE